MRSLTAPLALSLALVTIARPAAAENAEEKRFLLEVCSVGPWADLARAEQARGDALQTASRVLPNPSLSVEHQQAITPFEDTETTIGLSVPLGIGGRHFILNDASDQRRDASRLTAKATMRDAALAARGDLVELVAAQARLAVVERGDAQLDAVAKDIEELAAAGDMAPYDALRQQNAAELHHTERALAAAKVEMARARAGAWAATAVDTSMMTLPELARGMSPEGVTHPRVLAFDATLRATALERDAASRRAVPDIEIFAGYRVTTTPGFGVGHGFTLSIKIPITFFDHGQGEDAILRAEESQLMADRAIFAWRSDVDLRTAKASEDALEAASTKLAEAIERAEKLDEDARTLYRAGESSIGDLLTALAATERAALTAVDVEADLARARIAEMRARGSLFDTALDDACTVGGS